MAFCPICKREAAALSDRAEEVDGINCPRHGKFKISGTVFAIDREKRATPEQWEAALEKAKARQPRAAAPLILSYDF